MQFFTHSSAATWLAQLNALLQNKTLLNHKASILNDGCTSSSDSLLHSLLQEFSKSDTLALSYTKSLHEAPYELTYAHLHALANQIAASLSTLGLFGEIIPVLLPQSPELYIAILGILKSGNIYCPLLPDTQAERIKFVCEDVKAEYAFGSTDVLPSHVKALSISLDVSDSDFTPPAIELDSLAYIMYTSGSTGTPKAVQITHRNASTSIMAHDFIFQETHSAQGDRFLQFANSTFDISIFEMFSCWARGMTLVAADRPLLLSSLPELIEKQQINYLELTPSVAGLLPGQDDIRFGSIKAFLTIGEMLTSQVQRKWAGKLYNAYGPSKSHITWILLTI
jgi:non-ribosomal peptide synthetase component F